MMKDQLLKIIAQHTPYTIEEVEQVFEWTESFDDTIEVLNLATAHRLTISGAYNEFTK